MSNPSWGFPLTRASEYNSEGNLGFRKPSSGGNRQECARSRFLNKSMAMPSSFGAEIVSVGLRVAFDERISYERDIKLQVAKVISVRICCCWSLWDGKDEVQTQICGEDLKNVKTRPEEAFKRPQEPMTRKLKKYIKYNWESSNAGMMGSGQSDAFKIVIRDQIPSWIDGKYFSASTLFGSKMRSAILGQKVMGGEEKGT